MIADFEEIEAFAETQFQNSLAATDAIHFSESVHYQKRTKVLENLRASMIGDEPDFQGLETWHGMAAHASILCVDLRGSTDRAIRIGAKDTYLTMHTYLPTMAELVVRAGGRIVGLRGDGLIAAFGVTKRDDRPNEWETEGSRSCQTAAQCGTAMVEATEEIINRIFDDHEVESGCQIGVGVSVGGIVITRIGLRDANEVTAYGSCVNQACKLSEKSEHVRLCQGAVDIFPSSKDGKVKFRRSFDGHIITFPNPMLKRRRAVSK